MIDATTFWGFVIIATVFGFLLGWTAVSPMWGLGGRLVFAIVLSLTACSLCLNVFDNSVIESTAVGHPASIEIVDSYDGGYYMLLWHDLSIKLKNGKILKYDDPYVWKQFKVGSHYNYTEYDAFSYVEGNVTFSDYKYIGVI